jgi:hypothetical protein
LIWPFGQISSSSVSRTSLVHLHTSNPDSGFTVKQEGWEDKLQKQFEAMAKEEFGIEIDDKVFLG